MQLSKRMQAVADMVTPGNRVADIGTDHGYVSIYLAEHGVAANVIAMDVRPGPLSRAKENIVKYNLSEKIETRLSDGLQKLKENEADTIIVAGMGGLLTVRILEAGLLVLDTVKELVLQPQSDIDSVRRFLHEHEFKIIDENMLIDEGKYYVMMKVVHGRDVHYDEVDDQYGRLLIEEKHPVLIEYLKKQAVVSEKIEKSLEGQTTESSIRRVAELQTEQKQIREALGRMNAL